MKEPKKAKVKCSNWDAKSDNEFVSIGQSYLHCQAQDLCGYDCVEANLEFCRKLLRLNIFVADLLLPDGATQDVIVIPSISMDGVDSIICLCTDEEGIKDGLVYNKRPVKTCIEEGEKKYLFSNYPHIQGILREYNYKKI
jgi:hypothetical protein